MHGDGEFNCLCQVILWIQRKTFTRSHPYLFCEPCRSRSSAICDAESRECKRDDKGLEPFQNCVFFWGRTHTKIQLDSIISHWKNKDISPNFKKKNSMFVQKLLKTTELPSKGDTKELHRIAIQNVSWLWKLAKWTEKFIRNSHWSFRKFSTVKAWQIMGIFGNFWTLQIFHPLKMVGLSFSKAVLFLKGLCC